MDIFVVFDKEYIARWCGFKRKEKCTIEYGDVVCACDTENCNIDNQCDFSSWSWSTTQTNTKTRDTTFVSTTNQTSTTTTTVKSYPPSTKAETTTTTIASPPMTEGIEVQQ